MSKDDIEKAVREAEQYAEEDKKRREEVETKNQADSLVYQTDKLLKDMEGKITEEEKANATSKQAELKTAIEGGDLEDIKTKMTALETSLHDITQKMYAQAAQEQPQQEQPEAQADDGVVDADYTDVE